MAAGPLPLLGQPRSVGVRPPGHPRQGNKLSLTLTISLSDTSTAALSTTGVHPDKLVHFSLQMASGLRNMCIHAQRL